MKSAALLASLGAIACGDNADPCASVAGDCLAISVESSSVSEVDQLELDVLYAGIHGTTSTQPAGGGVVGLPIDTAIALTAPSGDPFGIGVVAAGKLAGVVRGTGAASTTFTPGARAAIAIALSPPDDCVPGSFYCGGDRLAGDPTTLYQCNGGGVPLARGVCELGCLIRPGNDDACRGAGGCVENSFYCGGNKVDGDPQSLYRCSGGAGVDRVECVNGCVINPGDDDACR